MANLKTGDKKTKAQSMGMHTEVLTGKTQQKFFNPDEAENFFYWGTYDVDYLIAAKACSSDALWEAFDKYDSTACVNASMPVAAVIDGGMVRISSASKAI